MALLAITDKEGNLSRVELEPGRRYSIGRSSKNDVVLSDRSLSRQHAELFEENGRWMVRDCGSSNGTFLDGARVDEPALLRPGSRLALGSCTALFEPTETSQDKVSFSDAPLPSQGTIMISLADAMAEPEPTGPGLEEARAEIDALRRRLEIVEKANLELLAHEPLDVLLPKILDLVFEAIRPDRAALLCRDEQGALVARAFRSEGEQEMTVSRGVARVVLEKRASILTADAEADLEGGASIFGIRALMAVPLWTNKEVIGLIYADSRSMARRFGRPDLKLLTILANVAAIQMENAQLFGEQVEKQRLEREAQAAAEIQRRLLPSRAPGFDGYAFLGSNTPCYEAGGDYYDWLPLDDDRMGLLLGDVAGKGMGAALLMAVLQSAFHARMETGYRPEELIRKLNAAISRSAPSNRFVTLVYMELDRTSHTLRWVNAGHAPSPLLVRASGQTEELPSGGVPLGILDGIEYPVTETALEPGDAVFACSDGVTDIENGEGETFGEERLRDLLASVAGRPAAEVGRAVEEALDSFAGDTPSPDDVTYLYVQREP